MDYQYAGYGLDMAFSRMPDDVKSISLGSRMVIHSRYDHAASFRLRAQGFFASAVRSNAPFTLTLGERAQTFEREALMVVGPGCCVSCDFLGPVEGRFVSMVPEAIEEVLGPAATYEIPSSLHGPTDDIMAWHLLRAIDAAVASGQNVDPLVYEGILDTLLRLVALRDVAVKRGPALSVHQACAVRALILEGLGGALSVGDLARALNLSEGYFARAFKESFGSSPYQYISRERVARARALILDNTAPLDAIAHRAGFSNVAQMTRALKTHSGQTARATRAGGSTSVVRQPTIEADASNA